VTFEDFQEKVRALIFSRRQDAFRALQGLVGSRYDHTPAWPDVLLFVTPADFDMAYTLASVPLVRMEEPS